MFGHIPLLRFLGSYLYYKIGVWNLDRDDLQYQKKIKIKNNKKRFKLILTLQTEFLLYFKTEIFYGY